MLSAPKGVSYTCLQKCHSRNCKNINRLWKIGKKTHDSTEVLESLIYVTCKPSPANEPPVGEAGRLQESKSSQTSGFAWFVL